uniref:CHCH domain-containing protein n=1 Tax=Tetraselmis sp. GSL018 TaxID=582737 RepID=A0A061SFJ6_9CHLO
MQSGEKKSELNDTRSTSALSPCDVAALKKCLEENNGDQNKCLKEIKAFEQSCARPKDGGAGVKESH